MKRRKILVLIPMLGLFLTGCTFQEGFAKAKHWIGQNIYHPLKDWIDEMTGKKKEDEKKEDEGGGEEEGTITGVSVSPSSLTLKTTDEPVTLTATVAPSTASQEVTWSVAPEGVVTVSDAGVVTVVAEGDAVITASSKADTTKTGSCTVKVSDTAPAGGDGTAENPYSGAEAAEIAAGLEADGVTEASYYIRGVVTNLEETFNPSFGNYSFKIEGDFIGWRLKNGPEYTAFETDDINVGDTVTMYAQIQAYGSDKKAETKGGYVVSVVKATVQKVEISGEATQTEYVVGDPYNHSGLKAIATFTNGKSTDVSLLATWTITPETAAMGCTSISVVATYREHAAPAKAVTVSVSETAPEEVVLATYTFEADTGWTSPKNIKDIDEETFMGCVKTSGTEFITGYEDTDGYKNAYVGANGGSSATAWKLMNSMKFGKSGESGFVKFTLDTTKAFSKIKFTVYGWDSTAKLSVNSTEYDTTVLANKTNIEAGTGQVITANVASGGATLTVGTNEYTSGNHAVVVTSIQFIQ